MSNPPMDTMRERRPSLLGRLFRRSSSMDEGAAGQVALSSSPPTSNGAMPIPIGRVRRDSITEAVQTQYLSQSPPQPNRTPFVDPEAGIWT